MSIQTRTTALQNEIVRLYCTFQTDGRLADPAGQPLVEILDVDGATIIDNIHAAKESNGVYYADWYVPRDFPLGDYFDRWTFQIDSTSGVSEITSVFTVHALSSYINFVSKSINHKLSNRVIQLLRDLSNDFIYESQHIPIYWEKGLRVREENQNLRIKNYYFFTLDSEYYSAEAGDVYFHNGNRYTVLEALPQYNSSSSEGMSTSSSSVDSTSSSSIDSTSSSSLSSQSSSSTSSESSGNNSSSSQSIVTTTTTTTEWVYKTILSVVGSGTPSASGTLVKVSGTGSSSISFVNYESKINRFSTVYGFAYNNWLQDPRPIIRANNRIEDDDWYADYNGRIFVNKRMSPEDFVEASYHFSYFSDEELLSFLNLGLKMMNAVPPSSTVYSQISMMPIEWDAPVLLYAAITALRRLIFGLNWQEKLIIFTRPDDPNSGKDVIGNFNTLLQDYTKLFEEIKKDVKTKKLPGIALGVTPEYTLPGGRSRFFRYLYKTGA